MGLLGVNPHYYVIFQDVPSGFVVSGFDYSAFNGTVQYEVDESTNEIIIEKKVSDALYSFGLPQNIQSRDQLQIRTDRRATGISLPEITKDKADGNFNLDEDQDELLHDAALLVTQNQQASVSLLQRKFRIGYSRAGRLIDELESLGIVSGYSGSKAREVLVSESYLENIFNV